MCENLDKISKLNQEISKPERQKNFSFGQEDSLFQKTNNFLKKSTKEIIVEPNENDILWDSKESSNHSQKSQTWMKDDKVEFYEQPS